MYKEIDLNKLEIVMQEDITSSVSASIDLEQKFYNTIGVIITRIIQSYSNRNRITFKIMKIVYKILINHKKRIRLNDRLFNNLRNSKTFEVYNNYMIFLLKSDM